MQSIIVEGGTPLRGEVWVHGAKNAVLPILAATAARQGQYVLHHCPRLQDVANTLEILTYLGCRVSWHGDTIIVDSHPLCRCDIPQRLMQSMRSSILFLGALLARCGEAAVYAPGGCPLGGRPVNLHLAAMEAMGAEVTQAPPQLYVAADPLHGATVTLTYPSVGATENIMLAALNCHGTVTIYNAAKEPEIEDLAGFLTAMGASVMGAGTAVLQITGSRPTHDASYTIMPDRIEAATFLAAAAATGGSVRLRGVQVAHLYAVVQALQQAGARIDTGPEMLYLRAGPLHAIRPVRTAPYPGFPTDAQALLMAALLRADGITVLEEQVFENRFQHVAALQAMGADIQVANRIARIQGVASLHGCDAEAKDLRGAAAIIVAALSAEGRTRLTGISHLLRGYEQLDWSLRQLGGQVRLQDKTFQGDAWNETT